MCNHEHVPGSSYKTISGEGAGSRAIRPVTHAATWGTPTNNLPEQGFTL